MKKAKSTFKSHKIKNCENFNDNNNSADEESIIKTTYIYNTQENEDNSEKLKMKNEENDFLEKIYIGVVQIFQNSINKITNINDKVILPKLSNLEDVLNVIQYFKLQLDLKMIKVQYFRIKKEIYLLLNNYLIGFIVNEKAEKSLENNAKNITKILSELDFFVAFCDVIYNNYENYFFLIVSYFSEILKTLFTNNFKHVAIFIKKLIFPYIGEYKKTLERKLKGEGNSEPKLKGLKDKIDVILEKFGNFEDFNTKRMIY